MATLYQTVLGGDFDLLPETLRRFHAEPGLYWAGEAEVERGSSPLVGMLLWMMRMPLAGRQRCSVQVEADAQGEIWARQFGQRRMVSRQQACGAGLSEGVGPVCLRLASEVRAGTLSQRSTGASVLGLPLPGSLAPAVTGREWAEGERLHFDVTTTMAGLPMLRYRGWLEAQRTLACPC